MSGEMMNFPDTAEEFMEQYKIVDSEEVYTNGAELVPIFRMKQWFEQHPEPHWIPVTERLPETTDAVLTTYIVNGDRSRRYVEQSSYYGNDGSWCSPWDEYRIAGTRIEVIAYMPLPEPYKGVEE